MTPKEAKYYQIALYLLPINIKKYNKDLQLRRYIFHMCQAKEGKIPYFFIRPEHSRAYPYFSDNIIYVTKESAERLTFLYSQVVSDVKFKYSFNKDVIECPKCHRYIDANSKNCMHCMVKNLTNKFLKRQYKGI